MKTSKLIYNIFVILALFVLTLNSCSKKEDSPMPDSVDIESPTAPTGLVVTSISSSKVYLSWSASSDNVGVTGYTVFRDGVRLSTTINTYYSDSGLTPGVSHTYTVSAYDAAGNTSQRSSPASTLDQVPAFRGAMGGGAQTTGGRGGKVYEVTNLNDAGPGSLRECIEATGARTAVFRIGGTIQLESDLNILNPFITIAGQTAPGGGILLSGKNYAGVSMLSVQTHDVVVRYLRIRKGFNIGCSDGSCGTTIHIESSAYNVVIDHISISWNQKQAIGIWSYGDSPIKNVTISYCITAEGLDPHSTGLLTGSDIVGYSDNMTDIDGHHNLAMNNTHRNPLVKNKSFRLVNNIVYNWGYYATMVGQGVKIDIIGNLYKPGPLNSSADPYEIEVYPIEPSGGSQASGEPSVFIIGNTGPHNTNPENDNWAMVGRVSGENGTPQGGLSTSYRRTSPMTPLIYPIVEDPVANLESILLPIVGASQRLDENGNWVPNRDAVDIRLISQYKTNTGNDFICKTEYDVGGFPTIESGTAYADTDHDGMPDVWETANGLNPTDAADGNKIAANGFTNLENFLNGK